MTDSQPDGLNLPIGTRVRSADGEHLGEVKEIASDHYVIEKGRLFKDDFFIPKTAIANYDGQSAAVTLTFDDINNAGWDEPPLYDGLDDLAFDENDGTRIAGDVLGVIAAPMSGDFDEEPVFDPEANKMTVTQGDFPVEVDMHVHSADDKDLGKVVTVSPNHVMVEKGHFFKHDYEIPKTAIKGVRDGKVYLNVPAVALDRAGWETDPEPEALTRPTAPIDPTMES
jgi:hypothetical protein